jgi:hypothetical protein
LESDNRFYLTAGPVQLEIKLTSVAVVRLRIGYRRSALDLFPVRIAMTRNKALGYVHKSWTEAFGSGFGHAVGFESNWPVALPCFVGERRSFRVPTVR